MYLVHLSLQPPNPGKELPCGTQQALVTGKQIAERVEHVIVHEPRASLQVIGVYVRVVDLVTAEATAAEAWRQAVAACPELRPWELLRAEVPLLPVDPESFGNNSPD